MLSVRPISIPAATNFNYFSNLNHCTMKLLLLTILCLLACTATDSSSLSERFTANIDRYLDKLLQKVREFIVNKGMDPLQIDDIKKEIKEKVGFIDVTAELELTRGWAQGISNIHRNGDSAISYQAMILSFSLPLQFNVISVDYDFKISVMSLGPTGGVEAKVNNLNIFVNIAVDTSNLDITLQDFKITDSGTISIHFSGHPLVDWLFNLMTKATTSILHGTVQDIIQNQVKGTIVEAIDDLNKMKHNLTSQLLG